VQVKVCPCPSQSVRGPLRELYLAPKLPILLNVALTRRKRCHPPDCENSHQPTCAYESRKPWNSSSKGEEQLNLSHVLLSIIEKMYHPRAIYLLEAVSISFVVQPLPSDSHAHPILGPR
jgi:hypothetical protein